MKPNKLYKVKLTEMPSQTTRTGKVKRDKNGDPIRSVQIIQSPEQKREMLSWMKQVAKMYLEYPDLFPEGKHQIGNDPKSYTVDEMIVDFLERHDTWKMLSSAHLYRSFIDRHNWLIDHLIEGLHREEMYDEIEYVRTNYYIRFWTSMKEQMSNSIKNTGLWH